MKALRILLINVYCLVLSSCLQVEPKNVQPSNEPKKIETSKDREEVSNSYTDSKEDGAAIEDGTYSATVDYDNPNTGYSATYTLDVEVSDGQVTQIDFPNGGYLDEDHITAADIDDAGDADVEGEDGKTYNVHIDPQ